MVLPLHKPLCSDVGYTDPHLVSEESYHLKALCHWDPESLLQELLQQVEARQAFVEHTPLKEILGMLLLRS